MKWTPQNSITSASVFAAWRERPERVADEVGHVLQLRQLVVVGEDDGVALGGERPDLLAQARDLLLAQLGGKLVDGRKLQHGEPLLGPYVRRPGLDARVLRGAARRRGWRMN